MPQAEAGLRGSALLPPAPDRASAGAGSTACTYALWIFRELSTASIGQLSGESCVHVVFQSSWVLLLQGLHTGTHCKVRVGSSHSSNVETPWGVQQGDLIAGLLFNVVIDHVVREALAAAEEAARAQGVELGVQLEYTVNSKFKLLGGARSEKSCRRAQPAAAAACG